MVLEAYKDANERTRTLEASLFPGYNILSSGVVSAFPLRVLIAT